MNRETLRSLDWACRTDDCHGCRRATRETQLRARQGTSQLPTQGLRRRVTLLSRHVTYGSACNSLQVLFYQKLGHLRWTKSVGNLIYRGLLVMFPAFPISGFAVSGTKARTSLWGLDTGASRGKQELRHRGHRYLVLKLFAPVLA